MTTNETSHDLAATANQFRLSRIQIHNWGTFSGYHNLPVPRMGLLLTGASGSGKSSLLDALSAVLVPAKNLRFNAAAQDTGTQDRSRSLGSYMRGAYRRTTSDTTGEVVTQYLRPGATRSGIALTYSQASGNSVTLIKLMHLRGSSGASDAITHVHLLVDGEQDLLPLMETITTGIDKRALRSRLEGKGQPIDKYETFAGRFRRRLGIPNEVAQRLLHRTQAAKSLTSLDELLRDFMLDKPITFDLAEAAVEQFEELRDAHAAVVEARDQQEVLAPLRELSQSLSSAQESIALCEELSQALPDFTAHLRRDRLREEVENSERLLESLAQEVEKARRDEARAQEASQEAKFALRGASGEELPYVQQRLQEARTAQARIEVALDNFTGLLTVLSADLPATALEFAAFQERLTEETVALEGQQGRLREDAAPLLARLSEIHTQQTHLRQEADTLVKEKSSMPQELLEARRVVANAVGVNTSSLPFAGEILSMVPGQEEWRLAAEAVVGGLARSMIVPERLYRQVLHAVDTHHLGARLEYRKVLRNVTAPQVSPHALARKIQVREDYAERDWLNAELLRQADHECVEHAKALAEVDRGVTQAGQVKRSRSAHIKDDRPRSRRSWVIGVSTEERLENIDAENKELAEEKKQIACSIAALRKQEQQLGERRDACLRVSQITWEQVDLTTATKVVSELSAREERLREQRPDLAELESRDSQAQQAADAARRKLVELLGKQESEKKICDRRRQELKKVTEVAEVPQKIAINLEERFRAHRRHLDAEHIAQVSAQVESQILKEERHSREAMNTASRRALTQMTRFAERWPASARDLTDNLEYLPDYLRVLDGIEADNLPRYEQRFSTLLATQSQQNISQLSNEIRNAARQIRSRISFVNQALSETPYAPGRHLRIEVNDRRLPLVADFLRDLNSIATGSLDLAGENRQESEQRFQLLNTLMTRLASQEPRDRTWRAQCLDTRLHVSFRADERDEAWNVVNTYEGASGLSGGQRQKLVVFCLAAALRYQLTEPGDDLPSYALVVLDEAFDKTDAAFTRAGLDVFSGFGFQLLLATPMKMLQTLEEHVGGAAMVTNNEEGSESRLTFLSFEDDDAHPVSSEQSDEKSTGTDTTISHRQERENDADAAHEDLLSNLETL